MSNIMLDIETLSTAQNALVLSVGVVWFCENRIIQIHHIKNRISTATGDVSKDTAMWWLKQSDDARKAITEPQKGVVEMSEYNLVQELQIDTLILCSKKMKKKKQNHKKTWLRQNMFVNLSIK